jgi:hypothetical protein
MNAEQSAEADKVIDQRKDWIAGRLANEFEPDRAYWRGVVDNVFAAVAECRGVIIVPPRRDAN